MSNRSVVVYRSYGRQVLSACLRRSHRRQVLSDEHTWFPAVALAGRVVAFAEIDTEAEADIVTVRTIGSTRLPKFVNSMTQVGSIVVRRSGAVAFIGCAADYDHGDGVPSECRKPGQSEYNDVMVAPSSAKSQDPRYPRTVDEGKSIDPSSLRLKGSRLTWLHGGKKRHARLR